MLCSAVAVELQLSLALTLVRDGERCDGDADPAQVLEPDLLLLPDALPLRVGWDSVLLQLLDALPVSESLLDAVLDTVHDVDTALDAVMDVDRL